MAEDSNEKIERLEREVAELKRLVAPPQRSLGNWRYRAALQWGLVGGLMIVPVLVLAVPPTAPFTAGAPIQPSDFDELYGAVNALEGQVGALETAVAAIGTPGIVSANGNEISTDGIYCGTSAAVFQGDHGGYAAGKGVCESTCGGSSTAHVCTGPEMVRSEALGAGLSGGPYWIASGEGSEVSDISDALNDCVGFTSVSNGRLGVVWQDNAPSVRNCGSPAVAIACCD